MAGLEGFFRWVEWDLAGLDGWLESAERYLVGIEVAFEGVVRVGGCGFLGRFF
jgi:hypothetical protein